jgi:hypothetical protein
MKQTFNTDDTDFLLIETFQIAHLMDLSQTDFCKRYNADIERMGRVFKFLGLAEEGKESALGWQPTDELIDIIAERLTRPFGWKPIDIIAERVARANKDRTTIKDRRLVDSIFQIAGGQKEYDPWKEFVFLVLNYLGFLYEAQPGDIKPTSLLRETVEAMITK